MFTYGKINSKQTDTWLLIKSVIQPNTPHIVRKTGNGGDAQDIEQSTEQDTVVQLVTSPILKDHATMLYVTGKQIAMEPVKSTNSCQKKMYGNGNILKVHVYLQTNAIVLPFISTMMVLGVQYVQVLLTVWKCIVMILLSPQYVPIVKGRSRTKTITEHTSKVAIASSVLRLALGVVTALGVIQDNVPGSWRQIARVCRDLLELTVK